MNTRHAMAAVALLASLAACDRPAPTPAATPDAGVANSEPTSMIGRAAKKGIDKARAEIKSSNIDLSNIHVTSNGSGVSITTDEGKDQTRPKSELTPQGELLIDGRKVAANASQQALLVKYRGQVEQVAMIGMDIGVQGADLAGKALGEAIGGIFSGNTDNVDKRVEAEADKIKLSARKLCDQLPGMLQTQQALATALPEFKPYATMTQSDIDDCFKDNERSTATDARTRAEVQTEVRQQIRSGIRDGIREAVQAVSPSPVAADNDSGANAAAEAETASAGNTQR